MNFLLLQLYSPSLELILLVIAFLIGILLASAVYQENSASATNRIYAFLSVATLLWLVTNYLTAHITSFPHLAPFALAIGRFGILLAALMSALFLLLAHTLPSENILLRKRSKYLLIFLTLLMMTLNISPYAFTGITLSSGGVMFIPGIGLAPFSIFSTIFSALAVYYLVKKYRGSQGDLRKQTGLILLGILLMLGLIILTVLVPLLLFNSLTALSFTPIYVLIFLSLTAYAITRYHLFHLKVLAAQALTFVICIILFAKIFGEDTFNAQVIDSLVLLATMFVGYFLVRSVRREVEQREEIEKLSQQKSEFMSFASHEIRNPITAMRGFASLLDDGTVPGVSDEAKAVAQKILINGDTVLSLISEYLNKSKLELGQIAYHITDTDLEKTARSIGEGFKPHAREKGLAFEVKIDFPSLLAKADEAKLREVVGNLIDNSIKYTKTGQIALEVEKRNGMARVIVSDTGVGIPPQTIPHLFQKFSRADAQKMNLLGTGLGLFLAKTFIEGMGGKIWAESDGEDKGSRFIIELHAI